MLAGDERDLLLRLARASIDDSIQGADTLAPLLDQARTRESLRARCGVFVTLKERVTAEDQLLRLRGCIGTLRAEQPLFRTVVATAPKSAFEDPRFSPLTMEEFPSIVIELSVLTPGQEIDSPSDIVVGRDGVRLVCGRHHAVFLPQVAMERGWGVDQLLSQLAVKAGLGQQGWREATLSTFQADVFGERP